MAQMSYPRAGWSGCLSPGIAVHISITLNRVDYLKVLLSAQHTPVFVVRLFYADE